MKTGMALKIGKHKPIALLLEIGVFIAFFRVVFGISPSVQFYALEDNFVQCLLWRVAFIPFVRDV